MSGVLPTTKPGSSAEVQAAAFAEDERVYFLKTTNTWRYEDDDGKEMEFDGAKGVWVQVVRSFSLAPTIKANYCFS
jgi:HIV Tat-specific factor 1